MWYWDAISRLLVIEKWLTGTTGNTGIIVGSTINPITKLHTYGGNNRVKGVFGKGFCFDRVKLGDEVKKCETFNANCVLISNTVVDDMGILSDKFTHGIGGFDYGLRAREKNYFCWIVPGYIGACSINEVSSTWLDPSVSLKQRGKLQETPLISIQGK